MSDALDQAFKNKKRIEQLAMELAEVEKSIDPRFKDQFTMYKFEVLGIISENASVAEDEGVQKALAEGHAKVANALSFAVGRTIDRRIHRSIHEVANNDTTWKKVA